MPKLKLASLVLDAFS